MLGHRWTWACSSKSLKGSDLSLSLAHRCHLMYFLSILAGLLGVCSKFRLLIAFLWNLIAFVLLTFRFIGNYSMLFLHMCLKWVNSIVYELFGKWLSPVSVSVICSHRALLLFISLWWYPWWMNFGFSLASYSKCPLSVTFLIAAHNFITSFGIRYKNNCFVIPGYQKAEYFCLSRSFSNKL